MLRAARHGDVDAANALIDALDARGLPRPDLGARGTTRGTKGLAAIHLAAYFGHPEMVEWLVRHGAPVNLRDASLGDTALHKAVLASRALVVTKLLGAGASVTSCVCELC
jgi:ankyrin repeat protein